MPLPASAAYAVWASASSTTAVTAARQRPQRLPAPVTRSCCHSLEDLVFRRSHAGTDEPLLVGAVAATVVAIAHLFAIVSMPVMGSTILSMEVAVLTVMVAMIAMELIAVAVVVMAVLMFVSGCIPMMVAAVMLVCAIFSIVMMMVVAMISGFGGIFAVMMAMDVAAIFIVMMTGFIAVVVAGNLCRCGSFGIDILVLFARLVRLVRIHKMDSFLRRQVDRLQ